MRTLAGLVLSWLVAGAVAAQPAADPAACTPPGASSPTGEAGAALERGNALAARGENEAARAAFAESRSIAHVSGDTALELLATASAARAKIEADASGAGDDVEAVLARVAALDDRAARAHLRIHAARSLERLGRERRAAEVLVAASEDAAAAPDDRLESYALGYLAELYTKHGRDADALALTRRALFAAQRAQAPDALYRWQWQLARLQRASGDEASAIEAYRAAAATLRGAREISDPELAELYLQLVDLLLRRAAAESAPARQALLTEARAALEDQKAGELRDYFRDACLDAQRKTAPDEVPGALVVYPILLEDRTELVTSRGGVLASHVVPVDRDTLTAEVRAFRRTLEKRTTRQYLRHARQLYDWLIRPLDADLAADGVDTLVFVPGGPLRTIPFAALYDREAQQHLIEKIPVAITPGLTLTEPRPIARGGMRVLVAGISESVQGYPGLVNVTHELAAVSQAFSTTQLINQDFVTQRFETEISERAFDIVHVASHGEFTADASQSYLLTYDGRVSMDRLGALVGTTRFRERGLELLTLSACETAAGDDRAALGLAGVALRAGARSALATLWSINDEVSAELIAAFYTGLGGRSLSRARALQSAQIKVLRMHPYRHPGYWSPYLLISSWL
jgi:CHAT domain-containing protein